MEISTKLKRYSGLSVAAIAGTGLNGQVIYTDFDPDLVIDDANYYIDMDGDLVDDFILSQVNNTGPIYSPYAAALARITPIDPSNAVVASYYTPVSWGGPFTYLVNIASSNMISSGLAFYTGQQFIQDRYAGPYASWDWCRFYSPGFVGVRFESSGNTHYGWIRLQVGSGVASEITVYGYAYESTPDTPIHADAALGIDEPEPITLSVTTSGNVLTYTIDQTVNSAVIELTGFTGQVVKQTPVTAQQGTINISELAQGVYLCALRYADGVVLKKIYIVK